MPSKTISIALLVADTPPEPVVAKRGDYLTIYPDFLQRALAAVPRHAWQDKVELAIRPFDVVHKREFPDEGQLADGLWDAVIVTGSASSAYLDLEWTTGLASWLRNLAEKHPLVRIIGICYGHQIIARAFDGTVKLNEKGFEIGVYDVELTPEGKEYLGYAESEQHMHIHQVHRDIVPELPPAFNGTDFVNIGSTARCEVQGLALPYPTDAPPLPSTAGGSAYVAFDVTGEATDSSGPVPARSLQVLTVQGHPEFDEEIVTTLIDARSEMGAIAGPDREEGLRRAPLAHDGKRIGAVILSMLGVEPKRTDAGTQADGGVGV